MEHVQRTAQFRPSSVQIPLRNHVTGLRCGEAFNLTGMKLLCSDLLPDQCIVHSILANAFQIMLSHLSVLD